MFESQVGFSTTGSLVLETFQLHPSHRQCAPARPCRRDVAWARAHMRVIDVFLKVTADQPAKRAWLDSYCKVLMNFPVPLQSRLPSNPCQVGAYAAKKARLFKETLFGIHWVPPTAVPPS